MADFNFVTDRIATGGALQSAADVQAMVAAGINTIIDCRAEFDDAQLFVQSGMNYLFNGVPDDGQPKPVEWFQRSLSFALPALASPHVKLYAHCAAGINRGPSTCYAILRALGFPPDLAEGIIRKARPQVGIAYKSDADRAVVALGY